MDDVYAINVAKSQFRDGFNTGNPNLVLSVFGPTFTDMSDGRPSRYGADAGVKLSAYLADLFANYDTKINVIIIAIRIHGTTAVDHGWHELTLTPKSGGEVIYRRTRYLEVWTKQATGEWRISLYMDNTDLPDTV
jgi:ketosteroid isomerase-like protein